ncbi:sugar kinase [Elizabethkingia meningoseptica]|uniref:sugar kinase n=1 Tax=Elizabethkingia meningoseptica TaxID=238 RepID=UPI0023AFF0CC|nr:sugar kinase [Elizabethkingia meningoseptica]MDE5493499.1 sugar kinase [Elizabethkingia meningoseptica]
MKGKVVCFGEALIRYQPVENSFFNESNTVTAYPGGSEANVAVKLGQLSIPVSYISAAPDNEITREYLEILNHHHVDTSGFIYSGSRIGSYILLSANGLSKGEVIYDRNHSSFSQLKKGELDWEHIFKDCTWFHWTALTPALNSELTEVIHEALEIASAKGITISVDLNYRNRLWQYGKKPLEVMPGLIKYCHIIMGNIWASHTMLGTSIDENLNRETSPEEYLEYAVKNSQEIFMQYPNARTVANTFRFMDNAQHNLLYGTLHTREDNAISKIYETYHLTDRIGSGDAFMAGAIASLYNGNNIQESIENAALEGFNKLFVKGDFSKNI